MTGHRRAGDADDREIADLLQHRLASHASRLRTAPDALERIHTRGEQRLAHRARGLVWVPALGVTAAVVTAVAVTHGAAPAGGGDEPVQGTATGHHSLATAGATAGATATAWPGMARRHATAGRRLAAPGPSTFAGLTASDRLAVFSATSGAVVRYLTAPGVPVAPPALTPDRSTVITAERAGACRSRMVAVPYRGGRATTLATVPARVTAVASGSTDRRYAYVAVNCRTGEQWLAWVGARRDGMVPVRAPRFLGSPAFSPDGRAVAVTVASGADSHRVLVFDTRTARRLADGVSLPCPSRAPCRQSAPGYDAAGRLYDAVDTGRVTLVERYGGRSAATVAVLPDAAGRATTLAVTAPGDAVLASVDGPTGHLTLRATDGRTARLATSALAPTW